jgi:predicted phage terminase large subunit-like protein
LRVPSLKQVRLELAERSLSDFIRLYWRCIDPSPYCHNWHIDEICNHLQAVSAGRIRKLLITIPPRHMKSISVAVAWPAWTWLQKSGVLRGPQARFLFASYAHSLSIRDSVRCRRLIESPLYQRDWRRRFRLTSDQNTKIRFENDAGGYRLATSVDGALTGEGGDIIVVDDPHNVREAESEAVREATLAWWNEALSTRLNDSRSGAYVIIMQRVHEKDLAGHVLREGGWTHLCLPARFEPEHPSGVAGDQRKKPGELLWQERFGEREIRELEIRLGSYGTAGQLQQRPAPREGGMFEPHWFEIVRMAPADAKRVRYWDLAASREQGGSDPDWTAGTRVALKDGIYYIEDLRRLRGTPKEVEDSVRQTAQLDGAAVPIWIEQEPGSSGKSTIDHFARQVLVGYAFRGDRVTGSKCRRADPVSAAAEAGNVRLIEGRWNRAFLEEIQSFPNGTHDDQVDAVSGAFEKLSGSVRHGPQVRRL